MPVPLVVYHSQCADGFTAAWSCWKQHPDWEFYPGVHQKPPPDVKGRTVYLLDFAYKLPVMRRLITEAEKVIVLDHHRSAANELQHLLDSGEIYGEFDMNRSGARLAWEYFNPEHSVPPLVMVVEDRDLWRFAFPHTKEIMQSVFSYPYDFETYERLHADLCTVEGVAKHRMQGEAIFRKHMKDINELIEVAAVYENIAGFLVPSLNCPYFYSSEAGHILAKSHPFAVCWWQTKDGWQYSLRSEEGGMDVSEIAAIFGGGGHKHAAGFNVKDRTRLWEGRQGG